nr:hypothetical protein [Stenotrophomonas maltophilia]EKU9984768.1 hypothetical protein [Stenotrophomonas maltophilia]
MRVCDDASAPMLSTGRLAQAFAYSSMSSIDLGENQTPPATLQARGSLIAKSPVQTAAARPWMVVATEIGFYLFTSWHNYASGMGAYYYGDLISSVPGDAFPFALFGSAEITNFNGSYNDFVCSVFHVSALEGAISTSPTLGTMVPGGYTMRHYSAGLGSPGRIETTGVAPGVGGSIRSYGSGAYPVGPDPAHGGYNYIDAIVREAPFGIRGKLPGVLVPLHARPHVAGELVPFIDGLGLGQWLAVNYNVAAPNTPDRDGQVLFRLDAPWK